MGPQDGIRLGMAILQKSRGLPEVRSTGGRALVLHCAIGNLQTLVDYREGLSQLLLANA